ncbi:class C sortase [Corynebacterium aurimucosum]|nr:class C sortase [Corynebacterium aurimucosum]
MPAVLVLIGLLVMLYPVVSSNWNNLAQQKVTKEYRDLLKDADPSRLNRAVKAAREYNATKAEGPVLDPWLAHVNSDTPAYREYLGQLSGQPAMSQLVIPSIDSNLPVYHGTKEDTLQKGLGHLFGTSLPVGGDSTHSVITGHTGIANATLWDNLNEVEVGDDVYVSTFGEKLKYRVYDIEVVTPDKTESLSVQPGKDLMTLITCTPYGINTHRILVHAERVPMGQEENDVFTQDKWKMQLWMWIVVGLVLIGLIGLVWWIRQALNSQELHSNQNADDED